MLRITVDLIKAPFGVEVETLGVAEIVNDGTGSESFGTYTFKLFSNHRKVYDGRIIGFKRTRSVWWLLFHCLRLALWENAKEGELYRNAVPQRFKWFRRGKVRSD